MVLLDLGVLHLVGKSLGRFEGRNVMLRDHDGGVLGNDAAQFLSTLLHDERTETAQVNVLAICHGVLDHLHGCLYCLEGYRLLNTRLGGDLGY